MKTCVYCNEPVLQEVPVYGNLCEKHLKQYYRARWHPDDGWQSMRNFNFECFPEAAEPQFGFCSLHEQAWQDMHYGFTQSQSVYDSLFGHFGFRGSSKTTVTTLGVVYAIANNLKRFVVYQTDNATKAHQQFIARVKFFLEFERFNWVYGNLVPEKMETGFKNASGIIITKNLLRTKLIGVGLEQSLRGLVDKLGRPDWYIPDDLENFENSKTEESIKAIVSKVHAEAVPGMDPVRGMATMHQTPVADAGLYWLTLADPAWKCIERPLYKIKDDGELLLDKNGRKIPEWPQRFPLKTCSAIEKTNSTTPQKRRILAQEFFLRRRPAEDKSISENDIMFCECDYKHDAEKNWIRITSNNGEPVLRQEWEQADITFAVDPATSEEGRACDTAMIILATLSGDRLIVLDMVFGTLRSRDVLKDVKGYGIYDICTDRTNIEKPGVVGEIFRKAEIWHPERVVIETMDEYKNTLREIEYSYKHWWTKIKSHSTMNLRGFEPWKEKKKRERILDTIGAKTDQHRLFLRGKKTRVSDDRGRQIDINVPFRPLFDQMISIDESNKIDCADALFIAIRFSQEPEIDKYEETPMFNFFKQNADADMDDIAAWHEFASV